MKILLDMNLSPAWVCVVIKAIQQYGDHLLSGALISIDENKARVRILPF
jgi:hypothetical protein